MRHERLWMILTKEWVYFRQNIFQQWQALQEIINGGIDGGQLDNCIIVSDNWLWHEVVWIEIGKTRPFGASQVNLRGPGRYS